MSSIRGTLASRANGAKSKGPKTAEGKQRSAANSLRHGLLATTIVLKDECLEDFLALLASLEEEFQPATAHQGALVENLAAARWRLMRVWGFEKVAFTDEIARTPAADTDGPGEIGGRAFGNLAENSRKLDLIVRYENHFNRIYNRCLRLLLARTSSATPRQ